MSHRKDLVLTWLVEEAVTEALQVWYDAAREIVKTPSFNLVGEDIIEIILQGKMDSLLMSNVEACNQSDRFMNSMNPLTRQGAMCQSLIRPMIVHVKHHMNKTEEDHRVGQRLQQQFWETTYQPLLAMPKVEAGIVTPILVHHRVRIWMKTVDEDVNAALISIMRGVTALGLYHQRAMKTKKETVSSKRRQFRSRRIWSWRSWGTQFERFVKKLWQIEKYGGA